MKRSEIYRKAAMTCQARGFGTGACEVLAELAENRDGWRGFQLANVFAEHFGPSHVVEPTGIYWWHGPDEHRERILALCFMSAIAEYDEKHA